MRYLSPNEMTQTELEVLRQEVQAGATVRPGFMFSLEREKLLWLIEQALRSSQRPDIVRDERCTGTLVHSEFDACPVHD